MTPFVHLLIMLSTPLVPLLLALALLLRPRSRTLQRCALLGPLPALTTSLLIPPGIGATLPWLLEGSEFGLEPIGRIFLLFSAAIWLAAAAHSQASIAEERRGRYLVFFLLAMSGNLGVIVARDMLAFYLFFSLMSFSAYGLVVHDGSTRARRAGAWYIRLVVAGDMMLYAALVPAALHAGGEVLLASVRETIAESPHRDMIIALITAGFGVKAGALGLHVALPLVYRAAPVPAAAAFAGPMLSAGLLGWLRFLPLGAELPVWGNVLIAAGLAGAFYGAIIGAVQRDATTVLAYSSISQIGIMLAGIGCALAAPEAGGEIVAALAVYALHHAFAKSALFFGVGAVRRGVQSRMGSLALRAALLLPAAALPGVPLTSGSLAKEYLKESVAEASAGTHLFVELLPWTALATTLVIARFVWLVWPATAVSAHANAGNASLSPAHVSGGGTTRRAAMPRIEAGALIGTLLLSATAVWLAPIVQPPELASAQVLIELTWPAVAGAVAAVLIARSAALRGWPRAPAVPPGDLGVPIASALERSLGAWSSLSAGPLPRARNAVRDRSTAAFADWRWSATAGALEQLLARWSVAAAVFILITLVLAILLWTG